LKSSTETTYFPLFLDISKKRVLVVGGGRVAERKVRTLLKFKAKIKVISPEVTKGLERIKDKDLIELERKNYEENDLLGVDLVISATNNRMLNKKVSSDAKKMGIYANIVDDPELCDFIMPSIVKRGPLILAISTSGKAPLFSKKLRKDLEKMISKEYIKYLSKILRLRREIQKKVKEKKLRERMLKAILNFDIKDLALIRMSEIKKIASQKEK
jgi:siroheme synthase-like protein